MSILWVVLTGALAIGAFVGSAFLGDWVSEEIRGRLDRLPHGLLRLAARRLDAEIRDDVAEEWTAELQAILRDSEGLPITRLWRGIRYALGLLRSASGISHDLDLAARAAFSFVSVGAEVQRVFNRFTLDRDVCVAVEVRLPGGVRMHFIQSPDLLPSPIGDTALPRSGGPQVKVMVVRRYTEGIPFDEKYEFVREFEGEAFRSELPEFIRDSLETAVEVLAD